MDRNARTEILIVDMTTSLPAGERGSKFIKFFRACRRQNRRSPQGSVDRNIQSRVDPLLCARSLPAGERGSKYLDRGWCTPQYRRSPQGSVDRNKSSKSDCAGPLVAPRRGAWIEIADCIKQTKTKNRRSPQGSVDRNNRASTLCSKHVSRSPQGSVDRNVSSAR